MTACRDDSAFFEDGITLRTDLIACKSVGGAGNRNRTNDRGIGVLASRGGINGLSLRIACINSDAECTGLLSQIGISNGVCGSIQNDGNDTAVIGYCGISTCQPAADILVLQTGAVDLDLCHAGVGDGYIRALIEAHRVAIIGYVAGCACLIVGNGKTVVCPNLFGVGELGAVCFVRIKGERYLRARAACGLRSTAITTDAVCVAVSLCGGVSTDVAVCTQRANKGGKAACGAGGGSYGLVVLMLASSGGSYRGSYRGIRGIVLRSAPHYIKACKVIGIGHFRVLQNVQARISAVVTDVADITGYGSGQGVFGSIPSIYGAGGRSNAEVAIVAAGNYVDVLLLTAAVLKG